MPRQTDYRYNQTVIGDCGHLCNGWPLVSGIGGSDQRVICEECTRTQYGIEDGETIGVWVRVKERPEKTSSPKPVKKEKAKKPAQPWDVFLCQE